MIFWRFILFFTVVLRIRAAVSTTDLTACTTIFPGGESGGKVSWRCQCYTSAHASFLFLHLLFRSSSLQLRIPFPRNTSRVLSLLYDRGRIFPIDEPHDSGSRYKRKHHSYTTFYMFALATDYEYPFSKIKEKYSLVEPFGF